MQRKKYKFKKRFENQKLRWGMKEKDLILKTHKKTTWRPQYPRLDTLLGFGSAEGRTSILPFFENYSL